MVLLRAFPIVGQEAPGLLGDVRDASMHFRPTSIFPASIESVIRQMHCVDQVFTLFTFVLFMQTGYTLQGRVVRPAQVGVVKQS